MCNHDNKAIFGYALENFHDLDTGFSVQCTGWLICQDDIRIIDQSTGDGDALHLAAGHFAGLFGELIPQSHIFQCFFCPLLALCLRNAGERQRKFHIL